MSLRPTQLNLSGISDRLSLLGSSGLLDRSGSSSLPSPYRSSDTTCISHWPGTTQPIWVFGPPGLFGSSSLPDPYGSSGTTRPSRPADSACLGRRADLASLDRRACSTLQGRQTYPVRISRRARLVWVVGLTQPNPSECSGPPDLFGSSGLPKFFGSLDLTDSLVRRARLACSCL